MQRDCADAKLYEMCQNSQQKELQAIEQLVFKESTKEKSQHNLEDRMRRLLQHSPNDVTRESPIVS